AEPEETPEPDPSDERQGFLEVLLGLPRKPHDEVRREGQPRGGGPYALARGDVPGRGVAALHPPEHPVRTRLGRKVEVRRNSAPLRERRDQVVVPEARMGRQEPDAPQSFDRRRPPEQRSEADPRLRVAV